MPGDDHILMVDRRAAVRYPLEADVEYRVLKPGYVTRLNKGRSINMSRSGLLFEAAEPLEIGVPLEVFIVWPAHPAGCERWLHIYGAVLRMSGPLLAVEVRQYSFESRRVQISSAASQPRRLAPL